MTVQMFASYYVIERGDANRSYFTMFVDADKVSWTKLIHCAHRFTDPAKARETIKWIKSRAKGRKQ